MSDATPTAPPSSVPNYSDRALDFLVVGHFLLSVAVAFALNDMSGFHRFTYPIIAAQLCLAGFVGVHYPFRLPTRLAWLFSVPIFAWLAAATGKYIDNQWNGTFNAANGDYFEYAPRTILIYLVAISLSLLPSRKGWRLNHRSTRPRRGMRLFEFFAVTAFACIALTLLRNLFPSTAVKFALLGVRPEIVPNIASDVGYCCLACVPFIWICFLRSKTLTVLTGVVWCSFAWVVLGLDPEWYAPAILLIAVTILSMRIAGFEVRRPAISNVPDSVN